MESELASSFAPLPLKLYPDVDIDVAGVKSESSSALVLVGEITPRFVLVESESDISDEASTSVLFLWFIGQEGEEDVDKRKREFRTIFGTGRLSR